MAFGKNKRNWKKGKGGGRKKKIDSFEKKEYFKLKMPKIPGIKTATYGWTPATKTGKGITVESRLKDRIATIRLGDLQAEPIPDNASVLSTATNLKLRIARTTTEDRLCWLDFYGLGLTRDKLCSMIKKWVTLVEAHVDIKTTDGFVFRVFAMATTKKGHIKSTAYAQSSRTRRLRAKMQEIMRDVLGEQNTKEFVARLLIDKLGDAFKKPLDHIYPIEDACVRKVKLIKKPLNEDQRRITDLHNDDKEEDENKEEDEVDEE